MTKDFQSLIDSSYESRAETNNEVVVQNLQMTLFIFTTRSFCVRAPKITTVRFQGHAHRGFCSHDWEVISSSEAWFVKVVSTLFIHSRSCGTCLSYIDKNLTPTFAFEIIKRLKNPKLGFKFFELTRTNLGIIHTSRTYNLLLSSLCYMGLHDLVKLVFDFMLCDCNSFDDRMINFLVSSYAQMGKLDVAEKLLNRVQREGFRMSLDVYNSLLNVLVKKNQVEEAVCFVRTHTKALNFHPDTCTFNILIKGLCGIQDFDKAFELFNSMECFGCSPDVVTLNTLINGLCKAKKVDKGCELLKQVESSGDLSPNVKTFTSLISGYGKLGRMKEASTLFDKMNASEIKPNVNTFNALMDGFGKAEEIGSALTMYDTMLNCGHSPDVVTFTSLIDGHCRVGQLNQALMLWHEMKVRKVFPNEYTFSVLIHALCKENKLREARALLRELNCSSIATKPFMYNPVIDGFCKIGNLDEANIILAEMKQRRCKPDKFTFTILIIGNCMKGRMLEAICLFNEMLNIGCAPDKISVNSFVSRLFKAGMPNEAYQIKKNALEGLNLDNSSTMTAHLGANAEMHVAA